MGAGSAKGVNPENTEDIDSLSSSGSDQWENEPTPSKAIKDNVKNNNIPTPITSTKVVAEASIAGTSNTTAANVENSLDGDEKREDKKKSRFGFGRKKDDEVAGDSNEASKKDDKSNKDKGDKKDADKKGFKLFGWRKDEKKSEEKDEGLDDDIDELEKTFDSLGIVGKKMMAKEQPDKKETVDDIELLEPMRNRKNAKVRGGKRMNGTSGSSGSNGSKRTFKFSWETEGEKEPAKEQEDEWEYKAVVIEGFDIEKFRKANLKDNVFDSTSLPNAVGGGEGGEPGAGTKSPLRYDQTEQFILASIERDFMH